MEGHWLGHRLWATASQRLAYYDACQLNAPLLHSKTSPSCSSHQLSAAGVRSQPPLLLLHGQLPVLLRTAPKLPAAVLTVPGSGRAIGGTPGLPCSVTVHTQHVTGRSSAQWKHCYPVLQAKFAPSLLLTGKASSP